MSHDLPLWRSTGFLAANRSSSLTRKSASFKVLWAFWSIVLTDAAVVNLHLVRHRMIIIFWCLPYSYYNLLGNDSIQTWTSKQSGPADDRLRSNLRKCRVRTRHRQEVPAMLTFWHLPPMLITEFPHLPSTVHPPSWSLNFTLPSLNWIHRPPKL